MFDPERDAVRLLLLPLWPEIGHSIGQLFLLSRINGDAPRAYGLAAALRIVREQAVFNRRREAAHFGEHPKRKPSLQPLLRSHLRFEASSPKL